MLGVVLLETGVNWYFICEVDCSAVVFCSSSVLHNSELMLQIYIVLHSISFI